MQSMRVSDSTKDPERFKAWITKDLGEQGEVMGGLDLLATEVYNTVRHERTVDAQSKGTDSIAVPSDSF